ncbi:MAG TPA: hypothetical protein VML19_31630 [Verrucomicrobiae bacterium]|nr:hypothetical protein [Verrucomicrobiae bacterium]
MKSRVLAALAVVAFCGAVIGGVFWYQARTLSPRALWERLPRTDGVVFYIDFAALRRGGLMQLFDSAKSPEDPEYLGFVQKTSFNYKQDLDAVLGEYGPSGWFVLAKGRFDWPSLRSYAISQQGACQEKLCRMTGSAPDRRISFLPIQSRLMALAVSTDDTAALRLAQPGPGIDPQLPDAPVWAVLPPAVLRAAQGLPDGTRPFARAVGQAELITLSFAPEGNRFSLRLTLNCRSDQDAYDAASQLTKVTEILSRMMVEDHAQPKVGDLARVLVSGRFWNTGNRTYGVWPIERAFVENLLK